MRLLAARPARPRPRVQHRKASLSCIRTLYVDGRARLSNEWAPSGGIAASSEEDAHAKLVRAGFIRQSHSGIFQLLPLGLRVQDKITRLVDRYMRGLGASRVQLSAISSESLWEQSGRLNKIGSELFRFTDRKEGRFLLGPTHEEEITSIVARSVQSYKNLPLRLYQITQKYRDELRPRHGLLRGRDFCMKDLYTFDYSLGAALETYESVRGAYSQIFINEMKLPVLVAEASSGDMGGDLSHEYHIPTELGEDHVMSCNSCDYVANEEVAQSRRVEASDNASPDEVNVWRGITKDRRTFVNVWYIADEAFQHSVNTHALKQLVPDLDAGLEDAVPLWTAALEESVVNMKLVNLFDARVPGKARHDIHNSKRFVPAELKKYMGRIAYAKHSRASENLNLMRIQDGDGCPRCNHGTLKVQKAIELGHTFHLGTRYSKPMNALASLPIDAAPSTTTSTKPASSTFPENTQVLMQMGCHGIGISRIIGAVANHLADERGLNWPRVIAPYEVVVVFNSSDDATAADAGMVYDMMRGVTAEPSQGQESKPPLDAILDDRDDLSMGWKLKDADLVGYPVMVVLGREWKASRRAEVQCRRLGYKELLPVEDLRGCVENLLQEL
ncbi:prolyl-tRNA synthetase [Cryphonectria parasitica EP155]|uniref:proline--tRNA ligase n=1 Tax=Cryphonectria parasitica (strain ATCC 38755 / EP155) TaxID=660469 RepID=A0A9P4Y2C7_CRYP1|nr:prolyl-tRNA synthetase [Cryphonectria parasitica EP155]KAF3764895.1 prolyl-tRNA synthetase [Cryphonectria parasitica EP155]